MPTEKSKFSSNVLTLGMIGHPNAGKSSLINSVIGKRVVSVSKTPGHTKHFQVSLLNILNSIKLIRLIVIAFSDDLHYQISEAL